MRISSILFIGIKGAIGIGSFGFICYSIYIGIKYLFRKKPTKEVYKEVLLVLDSGKGLSDLMEALSKYPLKEQKVYLEAYKVIKKQEAKEKANG